MYEANHGLLFWLFSLLTWFPASVPFRRFDQSAGNLYIACFIEMFYGGFAFVCINHKTVDLVQSTPGDYKRRGNGSKIPLYYRRRQVEQQNFSISDAPPSQACLLLEERPHISSIIPFNSSPITPFAPCSSAKSRFSLISFSPARDRPTVSVSLKGSISRAWLSTTSLMGLADMSGLVSPIA